RMGPSFQQVTGHVIGKSTLIIFSGLRTKTACHPEAGEGTPRDLTPAQALPRYDRRILRFRRDGPLCDLIAAGGPSPSARLGMTRAPNEQPTPTPTPLPLRQSWRRLPALLS